MFERTPYTLTTTTVLHLGPQGPRFMERICDGDIAYWGLILQAERDPAIADYLLANIRDNLWEFHRGHGPTAADSAFVIEGLAAFGTPSDLLQPCIDRLVARHFDPSSGGFTTVVRGRAAYWRGPSADTTAQVAYLLARLAPTRHAGALNAAYDYLRSTQEPDGTWPSRWYPSRIVPTWLAARALKCAGDVNAVHRACEAVLASQTKEGSWGASVIDTAAALLLLADPQHPACQRGVDWLRACGSGGQWSGEVILTYWFDIGPDVRRMYVSVDDGRISTAYARLALEALGLTVESPRSRLAASHHTAAAGAPAQEA